MTPWAPTAALLCPEGRLSPGRPGAGFPLLVPVLADSASSCPLPLEEPKCCESGWGRVTQQGGPWRAIGPWGGGEAQPLSLELGARARSRLAHLTDGCCCLPCAQGSSLEHSGQNVTLDLEAVALPSLGV